MILRTPGQRSDGTTAAPVAPKQHHLAEDQPVASQPVAPIEAFVLASRAPGVRRINYSDVHRLPNGQAIEMAAASTTPPKRPSARVGHDYLSDSFSFSSSSFSS